MRHFSEFLQKIYEKFLNFIKTLKIKDWLCIILFIGVIYYSYQYKKYYNKFYSTPVKVDTMYQKTNKTGEVYDAKDTYIQKISDLKKSNKELYNELKNLKENPIIITKYNTKIKIDSINTVSNSIAKIDTTTYKLNWSAPKNNWYSFNGETSVKKDFSKFNTKIYNFSSNADLTTDLVEKDGKFTIMVKSDNPYLQINNINSSIIDFKKNKTIKKMFPQKRFGLGPVIGYGYDITKSKFSPYIGIGLSYHILSF